MTAEEIRDQMRKFIDGNMKADAVCAYALIEIAAQLAELNHRAECLVVIAEDNKIL